MNNRFILGFVTVATIVLAVMAALHLVGGGSFSSTVALFGMIAVLVFAAMLSLHNYWVALMLLGNIWVTALPIPLLDILQAGLILQLTIVALAWAERIIMKRSVHMHLFMGDRAMILYASILLFQLIVQHPGSARLGGSGGLGVMIYYAVAGWVFLGTLFVALSDWDMAKNTRLYFWVSLALVVYLIFNRLSYGNPRPLFGLYGTVGFPFFAFALTLSMRRVAERRGGALFALLIICLTLVSALYSQFRACPYIAVGMILAVAVIIRVRFSFVMVLIGMLLLAVVTINLIPDAAIPNSIRRTISTIRAVNPAASDEWVSGGEFGWEFEFRADLWNRALRDIKAHPLTGSGWTFSFDEIVAAVGKGGDEGIKSSNALSGGYHNGLMTLAAKSGIPAALVFTFGYFAILIRFIRNVPKERNARTLAAVLTGSLVGTTVIFLTNGGGAESVAFAVILGIMSACTQKWRAALVVPEEARRPVPGMPLPAFRPTR